MPGGELYTTIVDMEELVSLLDGQCLTLHQQIDLGRLVNILDIGQRHTVYPIQFGDLRPSVANRRHREYQQPTLRH